MRLSLGIAPGALSARVCMSRRSVNKLRTLPKVHVTLKRLGIHELLSTRYDEASGRSQTA